jgi:hypothetical protein
LDAYEQQFENTAEEVFVAENAANLLRTATEELHVMLDEPDAK